jgi:hypothetical protein
MHAKEGKRRVKESKKCQKQLFWGLFVHNGPSSSARRAGGDIGTKGIWGQVLQSHIPFSVLHDMEYDKRRSDLEGR